MVSKRSWFEKNYERVLAIARRVRRPGSRRSATDLAHTVFRRLPEDLADVDRRTAYVERWLERTDRVKTRERREPVADSPGIAGMGAAAPDLGDPMERVQALLAEVEAQDAAAARDFERHFLGGLSVKEIAALRGERPGRIYERLRRADAIVRRRIAEGPR